MRIKKRVAGPFETNTYFLESETSNISVVVDPAEDSDIFDVSDREVIYVLNTHGHFDHIIGNRRMKKNVKTKLVIHENDAALLRDPNKNLSAYFSEVVISPEADLVLRREGDFIFNIDDDCFTWLLFPGHTDGSVVFYEEQKGILFSGDFIFDGSIGRVDFPGGNADLMQASLKRILTFPDRVRVYPGHGESFFLGDLKVMIKSKFF